MFLKKKPMIFYNLQRVRRLSKFEHTAPYKKKPLVLAEVGCFIKLLQNGSIWLFYVFGETHKMRDDAFPRSLIRDQSARVNVDIQVKMAFNWKWRWTGRHSRSGSVKRVVLDWVYERVLLSKVLLYLTFCKLSLLKVTNKRKSLNFMVLFPSTLFRGFFTSGKKWCYNLISLFRPYKTFCWIKREFGNVILLYPMSD